MLRRTAVVCALTLAVAVTASAQSGTSGTSTARNSSGTQTDPASSATSEGRPATTTFFGDTGLWFVPTAEVLSHGKWSVSGYRRGTNYVQGFTNVGDFAGTFAVGLGNRAEVFGSFLFDTRVERDLRPLFSTDSAVGGIVDRYPFANRGWSGDNLGDFYVGAKVNLLSQTNNRPNAFAVRGLLKAPTGKDQKGVSTGKADVAFDAIASSELRRLVELSAYAGYEFRGQPDGFDAPSGAFRWGGGAGFPSRSPLRGTLEVNGLVPNADTITITGAQIATIDSGLPPVTSSVEKIARATAGLTWQHRSGFFVGGGLSWSVPTKDRERYRTDDTATGDFVDWQVRVGYHPGVRVFTPPPPPSPPPPSPPPPPVAPQNRPPTVQAQCEPCTVEVGKSSTLTASGADPDGDSLTYRWTMPSGALANPAERSTLWTAGPQEGPAQATVTVADGKGGTASANVTVQVVKAPVKNYTFEDVYFDFDRYTLRTEATRILDEAVTALREDPNLRIEVEGHTCNIGTAEYNLALGDRRANAVLTYLVSRGVTAERLRTISYGEEKPKYDNAREETRRQNRRAALTVNVR